MRDNYQNGNDNRSKILQACIDLQKQTGITPTIQELALYLKLSATTVAYHLRILASQGKVRREKGKARGIVIL